MARQTKTFSYDDEKDADIATWIAELGEGEGSGAIRAMLRAGLTLTSGATVANVYRVVRDNRRLLQDLNRKIETGGIVAGETASDDGLSAEQTAALENLKGLGL